MIELSILVAPFVAAAGCIVLLLTHFYSAIHDAHEARKLSKLKKRKPMRTTILIDVGSDPLDLNAALLALNKWRSKSFDVVLIRRLEDSVPKKSITQLTSGLRFTIRVYSPRKKSKYIDILRAAYRKSNKGEAIIISGSHSVLPVAALRSIGLRAADNKAHRIQQYSTGFGLTGVLLGIHSAMHRIMRRILFTKSNVDLVPFETYYTYASVMQNQHGVTRVKDDWLTRDKGTPKQDKRVVFNTSPRMITAGLISTLYLYGISVAALEGYGVEVFMITWILLMTFGLSLIAFDMFLKTKQKISIIMCAGFIPILLIAAMFVKKA